jgi:hypothetical protein
MLQFIMNFVHHYRYLVKSKWLHGDLLFKSHVKFNTNIGDNRCPLKGVYFLMITG